MLSKRFVRSLAAVLMSGAWAAAALAAVPVDNYVVREAGVGPLDGKTPFETGALEKVLPSGLTFSSETVTLEAAAPYTVLRVSQGRNLLLEFESDGERKHPRVTGITVFTPRIADGKGARVGMRLRSLYHYGERPDCIPGAGRYTGRIFCTAPKSDHIIYVFAGKTPAPPGTMPPPAEYAKWRLAAIMWSVR